LNAVLRVAVRILTFEQPLKLPSAKAQVSLRDENSDSLLSSTPLVIPLLATPERLRTLERLTGARPQTRNSILLLHLLHCQTNIVASPELYDLYNPKALPTPTQKMEQDSSPHVGEVVTIGNS